MKNVFFKNGIAAFVVLLLMFCFFPSALGFNQGLKSLVFKEGNILYVGGNGTGNYSKIQDAIDNASDGDTVFVYDDSSPYYESLFLNKTISLVGEDRYSTVVDAQHIGSVVEIHADNCLVSDFTLKNCQKCIQGWEFSVVEIVDRNNVTVMDNILSIGEMEYNNAVSVVWLYNSCYCNISDNIISELDRVSVSVSVCFYSNSCYNTVSGNIISKYVNGVRFEWYGGCDGNMIIGNHISNNFGGIDLTGCSDNRIMDNTVEYNEAEGIRLQDAQHTIISGNIIRYNGEGGEFSCGIKLNGEDCGNNTISGNVISNNYPTGIFVIYAFDNVISENNFIDNYGPESTPKKWWGNAYFSVPFRLKSLFGANSWDGNFWSDYKGFGRKIILGDIEIFGFWLGFGWFQLDRHPAQEPYDI